MSCRKNPIHFYRKEQKQLGHTMITIVRLNLIVLAIGIFLPSSMAQDGSGMEPVSEPAELNGGDTASTSETPTAAPGEETDDTTEEWTEVAIKPQRKEIF